MHCATTPESLTLGWDDGARAEFPGVWLRDNEPGDREAHSGQRLTDVADLPPAPRLAAARLVAGRVHVTWEGGRTAEFDAGWLLRHAPGSVAPGPQVQPWLEGAALDARRDFAWLPVAELHASPAARLAWLTRLGTDGLAFLRQVPSTDRAILAAVADFGLVLDTNYGRVFDVRSIPNPENLAYSDRGLGLHTDNPYRDPVPGFQVLHCLVASPDGGDSAFADGFALATFLEREDPSAFALLSETPVPFHYRSRDAELYSEKPLIQLASDGRLRAVHYNSRSIAPLRLAAGRLPGFYAAYRRFAALLREPRFQLKTRLADGDLVVFDNRRILHGRSPFSSDRHPRHLQGCYLARDSVLSAAAVLRRRLAPEGAT